MEQKKPDKLPVSLTVFWLGSVCSCIIIASHSNLDKIKIWDVTKWHSPGSDILLYIQLLGFVRIWTDCFHNYYTATSSKNWPEKQARSFFNTFTCTLWMKRPDGCSTPARLHTALMWPWPPGLRKVTACLLRSAHTQAQRCQHEHLCVHTYLHR